MDKLYRLLIVFILALAAGTLSAYAQQISSADSSWLSASILRGREVYTDNCLNCHQDGGIGQSGTYPPLAQADYLDSLPLNSFIGIILNGQNDSILVNRVSYTQSMDPVNYLSDQDVADVINFIRNSWGNKSDSVVTKDLVGPLRR